MDKAVLTAAAASVVAVCGVLVLALSLRGTRGRLDVRLQELNATVARTAGELEALQTTAASLRTDLDAVRKAFGTAVEDLAGQQARTTALADGLKAKVDQASLDEKTADLASRLGLLEAYWAKQGAIIEPIPGDTLASGYVLPFAGDESLPLKPVGDVVALPDGAGFAFAGGAHFSTRGPAAALSRPLSAAGEFSVLIDFRADDLEQGGPARIVSLSQDGGSRNFTIGQERSRIVVRLRTTTSGPNGSSPELHTDDGVVTGERQSLLYVRRGEESTVYMDEGYTKTIKVTGNLSSWNYSYPLLLANENRDDRQWDGEIHRVVFYNRAITPGDIE